MDLCNEHNQPNNENGYCPGCEEDENIEIATCKLCNKSFAVHIRTTIKNICPSCIIAA